MKKIIKTFLLICLFGLFLIPINTNAKEKVTLYLFYGDGCPHCSEEKDFLKSYEKKINIELKEVWYNSDNDLLMTKVREAYGIDKTGVPLTIIGNTYFLGYSDSIGNAISRAINYYSNDKFYEDQVEKIINGTFNQEKIIDNFAKEEEKIDDKFEFELPIFGKVNLKNLSISSSAIIIGLIDGFNPCAMWILLFLIGVLIGMKDKKKMLILGLTFLFTSALIYMLIMFSWLNIVVKISTVTIVRYLIGIVAIVGGIINIISYFKSRKSGCNVVDDKKRKKIFTRINKFASEKNFVLAMLGIIALAVSVNVIELACSAGLPLLFTQLLAINNIKGIGAFLYILLYILFFLLDDLIVFFIAVFTMQVTGISTKYNKYSHLVGGLIMLIIGILLIFKYELLTFGF